jgi:hypothetical protein
MEYHQSRYNKQAQISPSKTYITNINKNTSLQYLDKESRHLGSKRLDHKLVGIKTGLTMLKQEISNFQNNASKDNSHKDYFTKDKEKQKDNKRCSITYSEDLQDYHTERQNYESVQRKKHK